MFRSALTQNDLVATATTAAIAGQYVKLGERKIEAGESLSIGFGSQSGQESAQGRIFIDIRDNGTSPGLVINGTVRLQVYSPQNRPLVILGEWRTETLRTGSGDRTKQIPLPEDIYSLTEDKKLVLEYMADAAQTVGKTNTIVLLDTTEEEV
jgi:hypothetical protein